MTVPPVVAPLVWLLGFVFVVAVVWAVVKWVAAQFSITFDPRLEKIMITLVVIIVAVVVLFWVLGLLGVRL